MIANSYIVFSDKKGIWIECILRGRDSLCPRFSFMPTNSLFHPISLFSPDSFRRSTLFFVFYFLL